jgi:hypothetical protein
MGRMDFLLNLSRDIIVMVHNWRKIDLGRFINGRMINLREFIDIRPKISV